MIIINSYENISSSVSVSDFVKDNSHDAEQIGTTVTVSSNDLELNYGGGASWVGLLFDGFNIPATATITNAYIEFNPQASHSGTVSVTIKGQVGSNPAIFTTAANNITSRPQTTATVAWNNIPNWVIDTPGPGTTTPNISTLIQEIIDNVSYVQGDNIVIIFVPGGGTVRRAADNYTVEAEAPHLFIDYIN